MAKNNHSGYPLKWFKDQNAARNSFECAICLEILKDPVQVPDCGHQFCGLCIDDILKTDPRCPSCRIDISHAMLFKDHAANRLIRKLDVNCSNEGCSWIGSLSSLLEDHVNSCSFLVPAGNNNVEELDKKLEEQFKTLMSEISTLKEKHDDDIKEIKTKHEDDIKEINSKHEDDIKEIKSKHEDDIKEIKSKREDDIKLIKEMKITHEQDMKKVNVKRENDIKGLKSEHQEDIQTLKQEISELRTTSNCSGTFTMKIPNFERKLSQAISACNSGEIKSTPFLSWNNGYKIRIWLRLSQATVGYTGYMGVYMVLMKSDHDGMLTWPFTKQCIFTVVDQQDDELQRQNHSMTMVPRGQSTFTRSQLDEPPQGRGFKQFISHSTLRSCRYIKDDVVYIRLQVQQ